MNRDRFDGLLRQLGGKLKQDWGRFTRDPEVMATGTHDCLLGRIQEQRGIARQETDRQIGEFVRRNRHWQDLSRH